MRKLLEYQADRIETTLTRHHVAACVTGGTVTPRWIRFTLVPQAGQRISAIRGLAEEMAAALDAPSVRVARRGAAVVVEVPRDDPRPVRLQPLLRQVREVPPVTAVLGLADDGVPLLIRLTSPDVAHILVAGTTGSGKTALLRTLILTLALRHRHARELALVLVDPRGGAAFGPFDGLPHLVRPVIRRVDEATEALGSLVRLMEQRDRTAGTTTPVVLVIDELTDLMMTGGVDTETRLTRLLQRGRGAGIHVVAATQKPTAAVIGSLVKANFPVRLVGKVASIDDARVATGQPGTGAERLLGRGDFLAVAEGRTYRFQAAWIEETELGTLLDHLGRVKPHAPDHRGNGGHRSPLPVSPPVVLPDPLPPDPDEVEVLADQLRRAGWEASLSYRDACRVLGEAEGGGRFYLVKEAVDLLRGATATATATRRPQEAPVLPHPASPARSSSSVAGWAAAWLEW